MSDDEEVTIDDLREELAAERTKRQSLAVRVGALEERVDTLRGIVREHVVAPDGGDADGE